MSTSYLQMTYLLAYFLVTSSATSLLTQSPLGLNQGVRSEGDGTYGTVEPVKTVIRRGRWSDGPHYVPTAGDVRPLRMPTRLRPLSHDMRRTFESRNLEACRSRRQSETVLSHPHSGHPFSTSPRSSLRPKSPGPSVDNQSMKSGYRSLVGDEETLGAGI